jgi:hypothetical protein
VTKGILKNQYISIKTSDFQKREIENLQITHNNTYASVMTVEETRTTSRVGTAYPSRAPFH